MNSDNKEFLKEAGLLSLGIFNLFWIAVKIIATIIISIYISTRFNFTGFLWWSGIIVSFCIISKIIFYSNNSKYYKKLVDTYTHNKEPLINDITQDNNEIFNVLKEAYGNYDVRITFFDDTTYIITKDTNATIESGFLFIIDGTDNEKFPLVNKGFNIDNIYKIEKI